MNGDTEVLYNDTCPICSREVKQYEKFSEEAALSITYRGITNPATLAEWGITQEEAARRFHVRKDGVLYGGIPAFIILWDEIPKTRWIARLIRTPGIYWIACKSYDHMAAPILYWMHVRRQVRS